MTHSSFLIPHSSSARLRAALGLAALVWAALLAVGFVAPGGWVWGMAGPIGHMENYMISLWFVTLVAAPLLAWREPLQRTGAIQLFLLGVLAVVVSSLRNEPPKLISDAPPLLAAALTAGAVIWTHPDRARLWRM